MDEKTSINWKAAAAAQREACSLLGSHRLLQARLSPDSAVVLMLFDFFRSALHRSSPFLPCGFSDLFGFLPSLAQRDSTSLGCFPSTSRLAQLHSWDA